MSKIKHIKKTLISGLDRKIGHGMDLLYLEFPFLGTTLQLIK
jgi:hypothetical protein